MGASKAASEGHNHTAIREGLRNVPRHLASFANVRGLVPALYKGSRGGKAAVASSRRSSVGVVGAHRGTGAAPPAPPPVGSSLKHTIVSAAALAGTGVAAPQPPPTRTLSSEGKGGRRLPPPAPLMGPVGGGSEATAATAEHAQDREHVHHATSPHQRRGSIELAAATAVPAIHASPRVAGQLGRLKLTSAATAGLPGSPGSPMPGSPHSAASSAFAPLRRQSTGSASSPPGPYRGSPLAGAAGTQLVAAALALDDEGSED